jgi:hypothetical protein
LLALQMGKLKKGATPDREMAARIGRNMNKYSLFIALIISVADPDPGSGAFLARDPE